MRASFSPNEPMAQAKHFAAIGQDLGPWFKDYVDVIEQPDPPERPQLRMGLATTRELLAELRARIEVHAAPGANFHDADAYLDPLSAYIESHVDGGLDYRTVGLGA